MSDVVGNGGDLRPALPDQPGDELEPIEFGKRIRDVRRNHGWTLDEMAAKTGVAKSTLSKIENEQVSPTFDIVQRLAAALRVELPQLFTPTPAGRAAGRRTVTRKGEGRHIPTATYEHELLATGLTRKRMIPHKSRVQARDLAEFPDWVRHEGEEFLYVIEGKIRLFTEFYEPTDLEEGDSAYYDSSMGHAVISLSEEDALILWVPGSW